MKFKPTVLILTLLVAGCGGSDGDKKATTNKQAGQPNQAAAGSEVDGSKLIVQGEMAMQNINGQFTPFTGTAIYYYENGTKHEQHVYVDGLMEGKSQWWYENGTKAGEASKKQGKWDGEYMEWYSSGKKKVMANWKSGEFEGKVVIFYDDTEKPQKVTNYKNGKKDGKAIGYYATDNKEWETNWQDGAKHGDHKEFFPDETLKSSFQYDNGKRKGQGLVWYPANPKLGITDRVLAKEMNFVNDKLHGTYKAWWPNGVPMKVANFKNGKLEGLAQSFHENRRVSEEAMYVDGKQTGFRAYNELGQPIGTASVAKKLPQGRTHLWPSQAEIQKLYLNQPAAVIQKDFGNPDMTKLPWIGYRNINIQGQPTQLNIQLQNNRVVKVTFIKK